MLLLNLLLALPLATAIPANRRDDVLPSKIPSVIGGGSAANGTGTGTNGTASNSTAPRMAIAHIENANGSTITVTGSHSTGYDTFVGIPFAKPPTGELRFAHPQPAVYTSNISALTPPPACLQNVNALSGSYGMSEDCLTLNIMSPDGVAGTNASLPVMVWIYGGGFTVGAGTTYLSPFFIDYGTKTKRPVILVTFNYRLGIFGWGYGKEIAANGAGNLGLRDQLLALEWVKANIAAFGGDPKKVTVFGESAGAISISLLMLNPKIDLFRGAIMQSGAQSTAPLGPTGDTWQKPYDDLVKLAGCAPVNTTVNGTSKVTVGNLTVRGGGKSTAVSSYSATEASFSCLKALPAGQLLNASITIKNMPQYLAPFIFAPSVDGALVPESPAKMLENGTFSRIPFITGNNKDEGTGFVPTKLSGDDAVPYIEALYSKPVKPSIIEKIRTLYPNDPVIGSPFDTGNETFGLNPMYKQLAALIGDAAFQSRRRWFLRQANKHGFNQTWTYQFEGGTPGAPPRSGIAHGTDVPYVFGALPVFGNYTAAQYELGTQMMNYWFNFAYYLNPNGLTPAPVKGKKGAAANSTMASTNSTIAGANATYWLPHTYPRNKNLLQLGEKNITVIKDDFREKQISVFFHKDVTKALEFKRDEQI